MNASQNTFVCKESTTPEEYLKDMISHVQEDGYLVVARDYEKDCYFVTSNNLEDADLIEEFKLDGELADYDSLYSYYQHVLKGIEDNSIWNELLLDATSNEYARRIYIFAKRLKGLIDINAPQALTDSEKIMLIDSILLYKTNAVGNSNIKVIL